MCFRTNRIELTWQFRPSYLGPEINPPRHEVDNFGIKVCVGSRMGKHERSPIRYGPLLLDQFILYRMLPSTYSI